MTNREMVLTVFTAFSLGALIATNLPGVSAQQTTSQQKAATTSDTTVSAAAGDGQGRVYIHVWKYPNVEILYHCQGGECNEIQPK